jgi:hypothetical protein
MQVTLTSMKLHTTIGKDSCCPELNEYITEDYLDGDLQLQLFTVNMNKS